MNNYGPKVSIITVVLNGERYVECCIASIVRQTYSNVEYIVIDGGSSDGTVNLILKYAEFIDYWESAKDSGIADAMNKGIAKASGDYLAFIHADDYLDSDEALGKVVKSLTPKTNILMADIRFGKENQQRSSRGFSYWMNFKTGILHQGVLCHKSIFNLVGYFDPQLKVAMDYDFFLRAYKQGLKAERTHQVLAVMRDTGVSSQKDWGSLEKRFGEEKYIHYKHARSKFKKVIYWLYWSLYINFRQICHVRMTR